MTIAYSYPVLCTWGIAVLATAGVVVRPFRLPEAVWAVAAAVLLVGGGLLPFDDAVAAVARGNEVYLFLAGMMLLSEIARIEGVFDWVAARAIGGARGSAARLFLLVYAVSVVITAILSNDATAVVLTPAVFAVTRRARVDPLPYLFICAFVANAASFVLPISNPANLVLFDGRMPPLMTWLERFLLPSSLAIVATYAALRFAERSRLGGNLAADTSATRLSAGGRMALAGILITVVVLLLVSAFDLPLGAATAAMGLGTALAVLLWRRQSPWPAIREISWSILPLVAGLFVLVEALERTGATGALAQLLRALAVRSPSFAAACAGSVIAFASNVTNNLPAGLLASAALAKAHMPASVIDSTLIGVDLGPNLSITGSLATILWLAAIRREGEDVSFWRFLKVGAFVMPPALGLSLAARLLIG